MALQGVPNSPKIANPVTGEVRVSKAVAESGIDRNNLNSSISTEALKNILGIEGDAVGTLNTQELFNKTTDGGFF